MRAGRTVGGAGPQGTEETTLAHARSETLQPQDIQPLQQRAWSWSRTGYIVGVVALVLALALAWVSEGGLRRFGFSYVMNFAFGLSISLGCLIFVVLTHLFRAGWVVVVRRVPESFAAALPVMAILFVPILLLVVANNGAVYPWAQPLDAGHGHGDAEHHEDGHDGQDGHNGYGVDGGHAADDPPTAGQAAAGGASIVLVSDPADPPAHDGPADAAAASDAVHQDAAAAPHGVARATDLYGDPVESLHESLAYLTDGKRPYLNSGFFIIRWVLYLLVWSAIGVWYWRTSLKQDATGDPTLTNQMEKYAPASTLLFAGTVTFAAFDLLMTLDPTWYSTVFGVYYFAGSMLGAFATIILVIMGLQRLGYMPSVSVEHYHDLGKLLFAFVVFWTYIAFSQYMLIWYGTIPGEIPWLALRGMSTAAGHDTPYRVVALVLLFGHFLIPFLGLMSRHVKRTKKLLAFWAVWMLVAHWIDVYWLVMPQYRHDVIQLPLVELLCLVGVVAILLATVARLAAAHSPVPTRDPRVGESLGFHNY